MKKVLSSLFCSFLFVLSLSSQSLNKYYLEYIETYKEYAIHNQNEFRIPASITLAQGLLESGAGRGRLAVQGNNHFGIKCANNWTGATIAHDDDARQECFRKYSHAKESFKDHSLFLTTRSRYASLFNLDPTDYKGWAYGLSRSGYATDPNYAPKLIKIIEDYQLHQYDLQHEQRSFFEALFGTKQKEESSPDRTINPHQVDKFGNLYFIVMRPGEKLSDIAYEFKVKEKKLRKINELPAEFEPEAGTRIYMNKKEKRAPLPYFQHSVASGESLYYIAQLYGVYLKDIYKINKFAPDYQPAVGDIIKLR